MNDVKAEIREKIQTDECLALQDGEARVIAVLGAGEYVMYGDKISNIETPHTKESVTNLCVGATVTLGNSIYVAFKCGGVLDVMHHSEFIEKFRVKEYKSPIAL